MEIVDLTDEDVEFVEKARKTLQVSRRWAWIKLVAFVIQLGLVIAVGVLLTTFFEDRLGIISPRDLSTGLVLGIVFGILMGVTALSAAKNFGEFIDGMKGNRHNRLLVTYFEIASGRKQARNLITKGAE